MYSLKMVKMYVMFINNINLMNISSFLAFQFKIKIKIDFAKISVLKISLILSYFS